MPIRINLLAEAQAAEELRRRDPVKRAGWGGGILVVAVLFGWTLLFTKTITESSQLSGLANKLSSRTNQYTTILTEKAKLMDMKSRLAALNRFATNRFLIANVLDALDQSTMEGIQLTQFNLEQVFQTVPEVAPTKTESGKMIPGKPAVATERSRIVLGIMDTSANPGTSTIDSFKETLAKTPYFQTNHISTSNIRLLEIGLPLIDPESGKKAVGFRLECQYPDKVH